MSWLDWTGSRIRHVTIVAFASTIIFGTYLAFDQSVLLDQGGSRSYSLRRRNAIRRARSGSRRRTAQLDGTSDDEHVERYIVADDATTNFSIVDVEPNEVEEGLRLAELVFEIAKNNAKHQGVVHRGTYCDGCGQLPIRGVRYHCSNCPDFDYCETCEATLTHLKTHVFYKIKVPAPWLEKQAQPSWYPGKPHMMLQSLPVDAVNKIKEKVLPDIHEHHRPNLVSDIEGLYHQFTCMANVEWNGDPTGVGWCMDESAFMKCVISRAYSKAYPAPNLIHTKVFEFYDNDRNGVIDFLEFVLATLLVKSRSVPMKVHRLFRAFDLDNDGFVTRKDFLLMFRAYYELQTNMIEENLLNEHTGEDAREVLNDTTIREHAYGGRPLTSYFNSIRLHNAEPRDETEAQQGKVQDASGDFVLLDETEPVMKQTSHDNDLIDRGKVVGRSWISLGSLLVEDFRRIMRGQEAEIFSSDDVDVLPDPHRQPEDELRSGESLMVQHHDGHVWIRALFVPRFSQFHSLYLRVAKELSQESIERLSVDADFYGEIHGQMKERLIDIVDKYVESESFRRRSDREATKDFYIEEEDYLVGGSAATHTIYTVIQEALNELLDPFFMVSQRSGTQDADSATHREALDLKAFTELIDPARVQDRVGGSDTKQIQAAAWITSWLDLVIL